MCVNEDQDAAHEPEYAKGRNEQDADLARSIRDERERGEQNDGDNAEHDYRNAEQSITDPAHGMKV